MSCVMCLTCGKTSTNIREDPPLNPRTDAAAAAAAAAVKVGDVFVEFEAVDGATVPPPLPLHANLAAAAPIIPVS